MNNELYVTCRDKKKKKETVQNAYLVADLVGAIDGTGAADAEQLAADPRRLVGGLVDGGDVARLDGGRERDGGEEEGGNDEPLHGV
jgi:hypothetical protein